MAREFPPLRTLESLKKEAKRWLAALVAHDEDASARFRRAVPEAPTMPTLREVQHALAREHGFPGWAALKASLTHHSEVRATSLREYESMAEALLEAYRTGTPEAMARHHQLTWHRRSWSAMRTYVQLDLGKRPTGPEEDVEIAIDDARYLVAIEHGFSDWQALRMCLATAPDHTPFTAKPVHVRSVHAAESSRPLAATRDWRAALAVIASTDSAALNAEGTMTDVMLGDVAGLETVVSLNLSGSKAVTDAGLRHLAALPNLRHLDLRGTAVTDRGLVVLGDLPHLETLSLAMTAVTDRGMSELAHLGALRQLGLEWTHTGDAAIRALAGKRHLRHLATGNGVTDAGLGLLHELPVFKTWHGGDVKMELLSYDARPNRLLLRGAFTDRGMQQLGGLDGLFGLNLNDGQLSLSAAALAPLVALPNLGWLAVDAKDDWMPYIAEMPRLRFLGAQDTTAGDDGFVALSRSRSLEYLWGRRCHNLADRGFVALQNLPALRGLSVSCLNVGDRAIAALEDFPALRELMPMDVPDAGYRHIGRCHALESLVLMYCRDTTDEATEHIGGLSNLSYYFNSYTTITDRTPQILSRMDSLERITFDGCHGLTNTGVAMLARLPKLKELRVSGKGVTAHIESAFPTSVRVACGG
jgi:hypothetical protein